MKRFISTILIVILLMSIAAPALATTYVTATGSVNLRTGPGLDYGKLGSVSKGKKLKYLGKTSTDDRGVKWYKVSYNGDSAWISSRYSKKGGSSGGGSSGGGSSSGSVTATGSVNLRTGPGLDYSKLGSVSEGTKLKYLGKTSTDDRGVKWYKVSYNGGSAWISSRYSTKSGGSSSSGGSNNALPKPSTSASNRVTTTGDVNLRTGPGLGYGKVATVRKGSTLKYLGKTSTDSRGVKWYKVSYNGDAVWISSKFAKLKTTSSSSSSSSSSNEPKATPKPTTAPEPAATFPVSAAGAPDLSSDTVPAVTTAPVISIGKSAPADYVEVSGYYKTGLIETAVVLGIDGYRQVQTEVPNQYYNDALTIAGNTDVEYIGLRGPGYTVFGVCVGMEIESAKALLTEAGLELYDSAWVTMFRHPAADPNATGNVDGYDSSINLYTNQDGIITEMDWSTYTG